MEGGGREIARDRRILVVLAVQTTLLLVALTAAVVLLAAYNQTHQNLYRELNQLREDVKWNETWGLTHSHPGPNERPLRP